MNIFKKVFYLAQAFVLLLGAVSAASGQERLKMATTTSVQDSGLLPYLLPHFEKRCGCKVDVIAVGTGQALKHGSNGDVDMVLVHDPQSEEKFVKDGSGVNRKTFMMNDFIIVGPSSDPAKIRGLKGAAQALAKIQKSESVFISRGDFSGTHQKEKSLWKKAGVSPAGSWYLEIGQGMGAALTMADEKQAYTLSDRATWLQRMQKLKLAVLVEGDPEMLNYYSAIQVNPAKFPSTQSNLSRQLMEWLCSTEGQELINNYRISGNQMFKSTCDSRKQQR
jgi:tungstate transport system substrate-binding protein